MKHYNTTRNIKRKLRNLTRRIKAGRKSRLLFKTGDLGKNLSKMTKKVTQRGGALFGKKPGNPGQREAQRPHVNVQPEDIARVIATMAAPIQLAHRGNNADGPVWVWSPTTEREFYNAFADAVTQGSIPHTNTNMKYTTPRPLPPTRGALEQTARAAYAVDGRKRAAASPPPGRSVEQDRADAQKTLDGFKNMAARRRAAARTDDEEKAPETDFDELD